ncbi:hypothetical protein Q7C36_009768 [Tachysurus vachellii]|uniref:Uncharacterized protein n=1 Tax=Tachysurus vachellii TaxID=175792 RepID=A0AA88SW52_TACVA|nr:hypothetical protein Q7C36_009768 [Tachysurus vachellii]
MKVLPADMVFRLGWSIWLRDDMMTPVAHLQLCPEGGILSCRQTSGPHSAQATLHVIDPQSSGLSVPMVQFNLELLSTRRSFSGSLETGDGLSPLSALKQQHFRRPDNINAPERRSELSGLRFRVLKCVSVPFGRLETPGDAWTGDRVRADLREGECVARSGCVYPLQVWLMC